MPTAVPIAPVAQRLAAVAVPRTKSFSLKMAQPPMKPMPVMRPSTTRGGTFMQNPLVGIVNRQALIMMKASEVLGFVPGRQGPCLRWIRRRRLIRSTSSASHPTA